jgi:hypothetical protein
MKFTPGDWQRSALNNRYIGPLRVLELSGEKTGAAAEVPQLQTVAIVTERGPDETEANARLLSNAKELYYAARDARIELAYIIEQMGCRDGGSVDNAYQRLRRVIDKVEATQ